MSSGGARPGYLLVNSILYPSAGGGSVSSIESGVVCSCWYLAATLGPPSFMLGALLPSCGLVQTTLNHPTGAPPPVSARSIPEVARFQRPLEIAPEQPSRNLFPLDASGMNWITPTV